MGTRAEADTRAEVGIPAGEGIPAEGRGILAEEGSMAAGQGRHMGARRREAGHHKGGVLRMPAAEEGSTAGVGACRKAGERNPGGVQRRLGVALRNLVAGCSQPGTGKWAWKVKLQHRFPQFHTNQSDDFREWSEES